jgi:hypothetical protein
MRAGFLAARPSLPKRAPQQQLKIDEVEDDDDSDSTPSLRSQGTGVHMPSAAAADDDDDSCPGLMGDDSDDDCPDLASQGGQSLRQASLLSASLQHRHAEPRHIDSATLSSRPCAPQQTPVLPLSPISVQGMHTDQPDVMPSHGCCPHPARCSF